MECAHTVKKTAFFECPHSNDKFFSLLKGVKWSWLQHKWFESNRQNVHFWMRKKNAMFAIVLLRYIFLRLWLFFISTSIHLSCFSVNAIIHSFSMRIKRIMHQWQRITFSKVGFLSFCKIYSYNNRQRQKNIINLL